MRRPLKTWKLAENRGWLRARGLPYEGKARDLKERVGLTFPPKEV